MKITTKSGDDGKSSVVGGKRLLKSDSVFCVLGDIDELNSVLGWVKCAFSASKNNQNTQLIKILQSKLYKIMAIIGGAKKNQISTQDIIFLEKKIEKYENEIQLKSTFITPGTNELSARFDIARAVCRRAERSYIEHSKQTGRHRMLQKYLNRLSDLLFILARFYD